MVHKSISRQCAFKYQRAISIDSSMSSTGSTKRKREAETHMKPNDALAHPKITIFFVDNTEDSESGKYMWDVQRDKHTSSFIYNRFLELYNAGKKIDFGDITQEEFVGLVRTEEEQESAKKVKKSQKTSDKKNESDEEEDEDEDEDDPDEEQDEDFQIEAFSEYFNNITHAGNYKKFRFGREGYGIDQLGDVDFMMSFRSV